jgi:hypothetical protein
MDNHRSIEVNQTVIQPLNLNQNAAHRPVDPSEFRCPKGCFLSDLPQIGNQGREVKAMPRQTRRIPTQRWRVTLSFKMNLAPKVPTT